MFPCVTAFPIQNPKGNRGKWYTWNFLCCRDLSILKFITTIHRAKDFYPHFWMRKLTLRRDICWNSHCWVMGGNRRLILLRNIHTISTLPEVSWLDSQSPGTRGDTLATTLWGKWGEKRLPDTMLVPCVHFKQSSSAFNFLFTVCS